MSNDFLEAPVLASGKGGELDEHPVGEALGGEGWDGGVKGGVGAVLGGGIGGVWGSGICVCDGIGVGIGCGA